MITEAFAHRQPPVRSLIATPVENREPNLESPVLVRDYETGEPVLYVAKYPGEIGALRRALLSYPMTSMPRSSGFRNKASSFGYETRSAVFKREGCRSCRVSGAAPEAHAIIAGAATLLHRHLAEVLPARAALDMKAASLVLPDWRIDTRAPWTSGVVNWLSPLPYHYDKNNLDAWSAMPVVRRGVRGGHLHIPEYGLTVACRDGDVVYFAGYDLMHGVTPLRRVEDDGYRVSAVYYAMRGLRNCLPAAEELGYARKRRTEREAGLIERQRRDGLLR